MGDFTKLDGDHLEYSFWLTFGRDGGVRVTRGRPDIGRHERCVSFVARLPVSLFKEPELRASITVPEGNVGQINIDVEAAREALELALGVDVDLRITRSADAEPEAA